MVPFPAWLARVNRRVTNPILIHLAGRPPCAALTRTGRIIGHTHWIPIDAFPTHPGFVIACTYGTDPDWVRNVFAGRQAILHCGGERVEVWRPRLVGRHAVKTLLSPVLRGVLGMLVVPDSKVFERFDPETV